MRIFILILAWLMAFPPALMAEVFFYHTDNVGTPVAMTDRTGAVVWRANDLPFGEQYTTQGTGQNNRRLAGKEMDESTGLVSMGVRYMDPETGMFLQPDPVGPVDVASGKINDVLLTNPQRLNRYAYALNNPYKYVDPDGEMALAAEGAILVLGIGIFIYSSTPEGNKNLANGLNALANGLSNIFNNEGDNAPPVDPEKVKQIKEGTGKGNNVEVESQKEAEALIEKARPELEWKKTYEKPKYKAGKELHPSDGSGVDKPHIKWKDWSNGKQNGSEGHIYFPKVD